MTARFAPTARLIYALTAAGQLVCWDVPNQQVQLKRLPVPHFSRPLWLITPDSTVASGKTAFGTGSFWIRPALPRRLFIEVTMLCEKKFQNSSPART